MLRAKSQIKGNIGKIEAQYTPQGKLVCKGTVAVNFGKKGSNDTDWYNFVAWENTADIMNSLVQVGTLVMLEGVQRIRKWEDKEGKTHVFVEVTVRDFDVLARGKPREEQAEEESQELPEFMYES
jgi:single stranded DNA-binding protein